MADLTMVEILAAFDVEVGFPAKRAEWAAKLEVDGVTLRDVEALGFHCCATVKGGAVAAAQVLLAILGDPGRRAARLADLGVVADAKTKLAAVVAARTAHNIGPAPGPMEGETRESWDHDRRCRAAYCRVVADRRTSEEVAAELGVAATVLARMLERGKQLQASPCTPKSGKAEKQIDKDDAEHAKQVSRFIADRKLARRKAGQRTAVGVEKPARARDAADGAAGSIGPSGAVE